MNNFYINLCALLALAGSHCHAQNCHTVAVANHSVRVENVKLTGTDGSITLAMTVDLDSLNMPANNQIVLTPHLSIKDATFAMPKIVINGRRQQIMMQRGGGNKFGADAYIVKRDNGHPQRIE